MVWGVPNAPPFQGMTVMSPMLDVYKRQTYLFA